MDDLKVNKTSKKDLVLSNNFLRISIEKQKLIANRYAAKSNNGR